MAKKLHKIIKFINWLLTIEKSKKKTLCGEEFPKNSFAMKFASKSDIFSNFYRDFN